MKKTIILLVTVLSLIVLFVGAYALYNKLTAENDAGNFVTDMPQEDVKKPSDAKPSDSESSATQSTDTDAQDKSTEGDKANPAPDFTVEDANSVKVRLSDMKGKPVVLNFWASWCPPCKAEMPDFEQMYKKYGDEVQFMMVNLTDGYQETLEKAKAHISSNEYTFPVYFDVDGAAAYAYRVSSIPATYIIDAEGNLVAHAVGMIDATSLENAIGMVTDK